MSGPERNFNGLKNSIGPVHNTGNGCTGTHATLDSEGSEVDGGTVAAVPLPFRLGNAALCGGHPLVTTY